MINDYACFKEFIMMMMATGEGKMLIYDFETLASVIGSGSGSSPGGAGSPLLLLSLRKMYFKKKLPLLSLCTENIILVF